MLVGAGRPGWAAPGFCRCPLCCPGVGSWPAVSLVQLPSLCPSLRASPQVPIHALWNDGRENLLGALLMAGQYVIPEVPSPSLEWGVGGLASGAQARGGVGSQVGCAGEESGGVLKMRLSPYE